MTTEESPPLASSSSNCGAANAKYTTTTLQMLQHKRRSLVPIPIKLALVGACCGIFFQDMMSSILLPWGKPVHWGERPSYANIDSDNVSLTKRCTSYEKKGDWRA